MSGRKLNRQELFTLDDLVQVLALSRSTIKRLVRAGAFPQPVKITPDGTVVRWRRRAIKHYLLLLEEGGPGLDRGPKAK